MNSPTAALACSSLFKAMRARWRTAPSSASLTLSQGLENADFSSSPRRARPRTLHEVKVEFPQEFPDLRCPQCNAPELDPENGSRLIGDYDDGLTHLGKIGHHDFSGYSPVPSQHRAHWEKQCGIGPGEPLRHCYNCGEFFSPLTAKHKYDKEGNPIREGIAGTRIPKMTGCPTCGSHKIAGWMPTDFESARCAECGKVYEPGIDEDQSPRGRFLHINDCLDAFNWGWKRSGIWDKNEYIRSEFVRNQRGVTEATDAQAGAADRQNDYDPMSPEPRFLQMAKAELLRRRDLKCRDCGFVGLPAPGDANCPECGGLMDAPESQITTAAATADQIRANIRQQVLDQQQGLKKQSSTQESVHASVPSHQHDIHLTDLVAHYGFKANGDHYVARNDPENRLYVNSTGKWIHKHHGVHHEGHGHKSLAAHLGRYK